MTIHKKLFFLFLLFILCPNFKTQKFIQKDQSFKEIEEKIDRLHSDSAKMWKAINFYIQKSKRERNFETLIYAYRYSTTYSKFPKNIKFADSAIDVAEKTRNASILGDAFLNRGRVYLEEKRYQKSLDDLLMAIQYSDKSGDDYTTYKIKYYVAQNKIYLGLYDEALVELKECTEYFKKNNGANVLGKDYQMFYLYSLMSYIDTNTKLFRQKENKPLLAEAFYYLSANNLKQELPYFISSSGTDAYYNKNYYDSILKLKKALSIYNDKRFHYTENFYLGLSFWHLGEKFEAVRYFNLIDKEYSRNGKLDPHFRPTYEYLIKFYEDSGHKDKQLLYINKLMDLDRSYEKNYKYLYTKINKEYDTKQLQEEKQRLENSLIKQKILYTGISLIILGAGLFYLYRFLKLRKQYREKFENIIHPIESAVIQFTPDPDFKAEIIVPEEYYYDNIPGINPQIVEQLVKQLENLEVNKLFLNSQISQKSLSEDFGTNASYLSKVINTYKDKNFNQYINDLRINYIINLLKTKRKFLNKDVKELASISGFNSADSFSKNFQRNFDMKPSVFIKMMKENIKTQNP